ncbi:MAG TPA: glycosyl hydrolase 108 family protein, partial [Bacteroidia bacterium]|nr:glycosyl hydrolase 108 family protein [Bacteroidia bacterium]
MPEYLGNQNAPQGVDQGLSNPFSDIGSGQKDITESEKRIRPPEEGNQSQIGEGFKAISSALSMGSDLLGKYVDAQKDKWRVDGALLQQQGKTQEDITASGGNQYTIQGYQATKLTADMQDLKNTQLQNMQQNQNLNSDAYRNQLNDSFSKLAGSIQDPYLKAHLSTIAQRDLPDLMDQQMKAHDAFLVDQQTKANTSLLTSSADGAFKAPPGQEDSAQKILQDHIDHIRATMPLNDANEVIAQSAHLGSMTGNDTITNLIQGKPAIIDKSTPVSPEQHIQFLINSLEGSGSQATMVNGHLTKYGIDKTENPDIDVKNLTPAQATDIYKTKYWNAAGIGQLPQNMQMAALAGAANFGVHATKEMISQSNGDVNTLIQLQAAKYKQLNQSDPEKYPDLKGWMNRLDKVQNFQEASIVHTINPADFATAATAAGFTPAQITQMINDRTRSDKDNTNVFDSNRLQLEDAFKQKAQSEVNLPARYEEIGKMMQDHGYNDAWGNKMAQVAREGAVVAQKQIDHDDAIDTARSTKQIGTLSAADQAEAFTKSRKDDNDEVQAALKSGAYTQQAKQAGVTPQEIANKVLIAKSVNRMIDNKIVDPTIAGHFQTDM